MLKNAIVGYVAIFSVIVGIGYTPDNTMNAAQGKLLARRAAVVDCFRQTNENLFEVLSEQFDGNRYTIKAKVF